MTRTSREYPTLHIRMAAEIDLLRLGLQHLLEEYPALFGYAWNVGAAMVSYGNLLVADQDLSRFRRYGLPPVCTIVYQPVERRGSVVASFCLNEQRKIYLANENKPFVAMNWEYEHEDPQVVDALRSRVYVGPRLVEVWLTPDEMSRMRDLVQRPLPPFLCLYTLRYEEILAYCRESVRVWLEMYTKREKQPHERLKTFSELARDLSEGVFLICGTEANDPRRRALFLKLLRSMGEHGEPTLSDVMRLQDLLLAYHGRTGEVIARDVVNEHAGQGVYAPGAIKQW